MSELDDKLMSILNTLVNPFGITNSSRVAEARDKLKKTFQDEGYLKTESKLECKADIESILGEPTKDGYTFMLPYEITVKRFEAYISKQILEEAEWWKVNVITALDEAAIKRADERIEKLNLGDK